MLFKNPSLLAKNILRDQACCVRIGGKTPRYPTTLEISLPSMDHNLQRMLRNVENRKIPIPLLCQETFQNSTIYPRAASLRKNKANIPKISYLLLFDFALFSPRLLSQVLAQFKSNIHIMKILLVRRRNIHFFNCVMTAVLTTCAHYRKKRD